MKAWLSRQRDGNYMLTAYRPIKAKVTGTNTADLYVRYGDPLGIRNLCSVGVKKLLGEELTIYQTMGVKLTLSKNP